MNFQTNTRVRHGFSLIELLCSMGILLILAAIAVDNYHGALIKAKTARVLSDLNVIRLAIETYKSDFAVYPRMRHYRFYEDPSLDIINGQRVNGLLSPCLSTPVAYLSMVDMPDIFMVKEQFAPLDQRLFTYQALQIYSKKSPNSVFWADCLEFYGDYRLCSVGPDLNYDNNSAKIGAQLPYDPSNGTVSSGNIWTSSKYKICPLPENKRFYE